MLQSVRHVLVCALASFIALAAGGRHAVGVTPVQKVIELLTKLRAQVSEEGTKEAASYDKYACFCKEQSNDKVYFIQKSDARIEKLQASIDELGASVAALDLAVTERKEDVAREEEEAAAAAKVEAGRQSAFELKRANLTEGVDAITRAVAALKASKGAVESSLLALPPRTAKTLGALGFPVHDLALLAVAKPGTPVAFEYQSDDVIATLQELLKTFKSELAKCEEEAAEAEHDYNMVEGARSNKIKAYQAEIDEKEKISAYKSEQKSEKEGLLDREVTERTADQSFLDELTAACEQKAADWDQRSTTRAAELTAMTEAIGILKDSVSGLYSVNKKLVGLAAVARRSSFLQVKSVATEQRSLQSLSAFLAKQARYGGSLSHDLASVAALLRSVSHGVGDDHFVKVRGIIKDLLVRLAEEAKSEQTQKTWCDEEMGNAVAKRDKQVAAQESNSAEIAIRTAQIATLTKEIADLEDQIAGLHKALREMTELRDSERALNEKSIADAEEGSAAVKQATKILQDFYGTSMLMVGKFVPKNSDREGKTVGDLAPETFSGEYAGAMGESKSIFGLLEIIASDFDRTAEKTRETEKEQQAAYEEQKATMEKEIDEKTQTKEDKEKERETKTSERTGFQDDLKDAQTLHADALDQLEKLRQSCVEGSETYEERVRAREQEIEALKQALQILRDWQ